MKSIGLKDYRFSLSWSRVMNWDADLARMVPNEPGIAFYTALIRGLCEANISAHITLFHWDLPQALHELKGGWHTPNNTPMHDEFERYAVLAFERFGPMPNVKTWFTFNEPWTFAVAGYSAGNHAPGCVPFQPGGGPCANGATAPYVVSTNVLNAHARAAFAYRSRFKVTQGGRIGITLNCEMALPLTDKAEDAAAARRALDFWLGWWLLPLVVGEYPSTMREAARERLPEFTPKERGLLVGSLDVLGINHYSTHLVRDAAPAEVVHAASGTPVDGWNADQRVVTSFGADWVAAASPWQKSYPPGIRGLLNWVATKYDGDILVTENGWSCNTFTLEEAKADQQEVDYYAGYTEQVRLAMVEDGVPVKGYFGWSLMDNYEWADGYSKRFGLFYVDYATQVRTPKKAALWWNNTRSTC